MPGSIELLGDLLSDLSERKDAYEEEKTELHDAKNHAQSVPLKLPLVKDYNDFVRRGHGKELKQYIQSAQNHKLRLNEEYNQILQIIEKLEQWKNSSKQDHRNLINIDSTIKDIWDAFDSQMAKNKKISGDDKEKIRDLYKEALSFFV